MQGIYTHIPETNYVPMEYTVVAILLFLFMVLISLVSVLNLLCFYISTFRSMGTAAAQWLRCCAINRKVAGSIPASVSGFFIDIKSFGSHYGTGVNSASNRNEYQEHFLGVKAAGA
jgi:hypothetical protein